MEGGSKKAGRAVLEALVVVLNRSLARRGRPERVVHLGPDLSCAMVVVEGMRRSVAVEELLEDEGIR